MMAHKSATGSVLNFPGAMNTHQLGVLTAECDILIPAALENQIDAAVAQEVKARIVAEAANGPTMPDGDAVFARRGIFKATGQLICWEGSDPPLPKPTLL